MKKLVWFISFFVFFILTGTSRAYEIKAEDDSVYKFVDGQFTENGGNYKVAYEVDEKLGFIYEKNKRLKDKDASISNITDETKFKVISKNEGVLAAVKNWKDGQEFITFYRNGIYYLLQTAEIYNKEAGKNILHTTISFGRYSVDLKYFR